MERRTDFVGHDLSHRDLRDRDFSNQILFHTDLRGSDVRGCSITLSCDTFDGVKLDDVQVARMLLLIMQADIDECVKDEIRACVARIKGEAWTAYAQRSMALIPA